MDRRGRRKGEAPMLTRRLFSACWICGAAGLVASEVEAQQAPQDQSQGLTRTVLNQTELPGGTGVVFQVPQGVRHSAKNGPTTTKIAGPLTVEKGKPAASPA